MLLIKLMSPISSSFPGQYGLAPAMSGNETQSA